MPAEADRKVSDEARAVDGTRARPKGRISALWYLPAVVVVVVGVASAVTILDRETERIDAQVAAFARVEVPGSAVVEIPESGEHVIYMEGPVTPRGPVDPRALYVLSDEPGARPLPVREREDFLSYAHRDGHSGRAAVDVDVPEAGSYVVKLRLATDDVQTLAIGPRLYDGSLPPVRRAFVVALVGLVIGVLWVALVAWRRRMPSARPDRWSDSLESLEVPGPADDDGAPSARSADLRRTAFRLLVLTFALLPLQNFRLTSAITISDLTLGATAVVVVLARYRTGPRHPVPMPYRVGLGLMAVGGAAGLIFAGTPVASALVDLRLALVVALTAFVVVQVAPSGPEVVRLLSVFTVVGGVSGILSAIGAATGLPLVDRFAFGDRAVGLTFASDSLLDSILGSDAPRALDTNPNLFGAITAVGAAIGFVLVLEATSRSRRLVLAAATGGLVLGVLFSGSRSGLIALAVGLVPGIWRVARRASRRVVAGVALGLAVVVVVGLVGTVRVPSVDRLLLRENTDASARTAESTLDRYQSSSRGIEQRGWNSFVTGSGLRNEPAAALHDGHLEVWLGLGIVGFAGWILLCGWTARPAVEMVGVRGALDRRQVALMAVGSGFIANIAVMFFVDTVWNRYIWLLVALALTLRLRPDGARPAPGVVVEAEVTRS